jgi:hypothetical protein
MNFENPAIRGLDPRTKQGLCSLLGHLCGEEVEIGCKAQVDSKDCGTCQRCTNWAVLSQRLKLDSLRWEDLNDILILVDQLPVSESFFRAFLSHGNIELTFEELKEGVETFEGYAVLLFGNGRFAYRQLKMLDSQSLRKEMKGLDRLASEILEKDFEPRRPALDLPAEIDRQSTWLLGYIAKNKALREVMMFTAMAVQHGLEDEKKFLKGKDEEQRQAYLQMKERLESNDEWRKTYSDFESLKKEVYQLQDEINESRKRGCLNTSHYLAMDYLDVYVATSMREKWEFEDVHTVSSEIFGHAALDSLKLRYFDPTQSFLENRVDKGLVEALMLKRARCTIYMAQETDTFGKDSELATTLAQGKPVIVFVPEIQITEYAKIASSRPLAYLQRRLPQLMSEERIPTKYVRDVLEFLQKTASFDPYFQVLGQEEREFLDANDLQKDRLRICNILAEAEKNLFDNRAKGLQRSHPLALQVHLESGVANGVLVVRSVSNCAELLKNLLTNTCEFKFDGERERGILCLVEKISNSPFRVVTQNPTVSNAFWSRYLSRA